MEQLENTITKELIDAQFNDFIKIVYENTNFNFRPGQREAIINLIYNSLVENKINQIIEAPTGTGKSIINLLSATFLAHYYEKSSYILCSDLYLYSQYEEAIKANKYFEDKIAVIKGQYGNYTCYLNGQDFRSGVCRAAQASWTSILKPYFKEYKDKPNEWEYPCALKCDYCKQKIKIREAKVVVTTYQNLLYSYLQFDLNNFIGENRAENLKNAKITMPFSLRPKSYCFCDEAHNIPQIVQAHFTPKIKLSDFEIHAEIYNYVFSNNLICMDFDHTEFNITEKFKNEKALYEKFIFNYENISKNV